MCTLLVIFGLKVFRTIGFSDQWCVGILGCPRIIGGYNCRYCTNCVFIRCLKWLDINLIMYCNVEKYWFTFGVVQYYGDMVVYL